MQAPPFETPENSEPSGGTNNGNDFVTPELLSELLNEHLAESDSTPLVVKDSDLIAHVVSGLIATHQRLHEDGPLPVMVEATWMATSAALLLENLGLKIQRLIDQGIDAEKAKNMVLRGAAHG